MVTVAGLAACLVPGFAWISVIDRLRGGVVDLAILALPTRGHDLECLLLRTERLFAILPKNHRLARKPNVLVKKLRNESFLLLRDDHCFRETAIEVCKPARRIPRVVFESGQFSSILAMVGAGLGVFIVPEMALERRADCSFVLVDDEHASGHHRCGRPERVIFLLVCSAHS